MRRLLLVVALLALSGCGDVRNGGAYCDEGGQLRCSTPEGPGLAYCVSPGFDPACLDAMTCTGDDIRFAGFCALNADGDFVVDCEGSSGGPGWRPYCP